MLRKLIIIVPGCGAVQCSSTMEAATKNIRKTINSENDQGASPQKETIERFISNFMHNNRILINAVHHRHCKTETILCCFFSLFFSLWICEVMEY